MKKKAALIISALLCLRYLTACGGNAADLDAIRIEYEGEELSYLEMLNGSEINGITAVIEPSDFSGEISWKSDDSGIVKVSSSVGDSCSIIAKKTGIARLSAVCGDKTATVKITVNKDPDNLTSRDTAVSINGKAYPVEMLNIYYAQNYYDFAQQYSEYAAYYGLDLAAGIESLAEQSCSYSEDGTWRGYFLEAAVSQFREIQALCSYAEENDIVLDDDETVYIDSMLELLDSAAAEEGYNSTDEYICAGYGDGTSREQYREYLYDSSLAEKVYNSFVNRIEYSDEELDAHYLELGYEEGSNSFRVTAMRHILIMAEADDNGEYSETAIAEAHNKAESIYNEWLAGDCTEDSFSELANQYSEDSGSNTSGGYYGDIYEGQLVESINSWLYDEEHETGDTTIIDIDDYYVGTHVIYFSGYGDIYSRVISFNDLKNSTISQWLSALEENSRYQQGMDYDSIGRF